MRLLRRIGLVVCAAVVAAAAAGLAAAPSEAKTTWLCRPGVRPDPCAPGLSTTVYSPTGRVLRVTHPKAVRNPKVDCFYVYPTVSQQPGALSDLKIEAPERDMARYQAARYSQYCHVYAPMYRQLTLHGILNPSAITPGQASVPLADVRSAFADYLKHDNHGRGFVLIGHSQGSFLLRSLMASDVDPKPAVRRRLLSAILLGGNVAVAAGRDVGGDFQHVPACRSAEQLGCVIAWSTFDQAVPANSSFGRTTTPGQQVLCTDPAALGGGAGAADLILPSRPFAPQTVLGSAWANDGLNVPTPSTTWVEEPGAYTVTCSSAGGANVLQVTPRNGAPALRALPDATWGLHLFDNNIALGNLLNIVRREAAAYAARHGG